MTVSKGTLALFTDNAESVSARVGRVETWRGALEYAVAVCSGHPEGPPQKTMAAPGMGPRGEHYLNRLCRERGIALAQNGLRTLNRGIDVAVTPVDYGIADTGTLVINCTDEEMRLATMIPDIHVAVLPAERIRRTVFDLETELGAMMKRPSDYTAFITGPSRTADIERVLALGVHGPLELHILLLENNIWDGPGN